MRLHQNVGIEDRIVRVVAGLALGGVLLGGLVGGPIAYVVGVVAAILVVTGVAGFCPIYALVGISTRPAGRSSLSPGGR